MGDDTAAALSRLGIAPSRWRAVEIRPIAGTGQFMLTVTPRRGYASSTVLPDQESVREVGRLVNQASRDDLAQSASERRRLRHEWQRTRGRAPSMDVTIAGTDKDIARRRALRNRRERERRARRKAA
jgi:hypothetical protein